MRRLSLAVLLLMTLTISSTARAEDFGLHGFDVTFTDAAGVGITQAGSHPYALRTSFEANTATEGEDTFPAAPLKDLEITQIPGFIGDQGAVPQCPPLDFLQRYNESPNIPQCEDSSAVGVIEVEVGTGEGKEGKTLITSPLYNLVPVPGKVARLGFWVFANPVTLDVEISQTPPYRLVAQSRNISQGLEFFGAEVTIWGVPTSPVHDKERGRCYAGAGTCPAGVSEAPFLTLPRACTGPLATNYELDSWSDPGAWVGGVALTHDDALPSNPRGFSGCGKLSFHPTVEATPSSTQAVSPAGLDFTIDVTDEGLKSPDGLAGADIEAIETILPEGMGANPSAAEGLAGCTEAQLQAESLVREAGVGCPEASKIGRVQAETPLLEDHALRGAVYLASPYQNPFGSLLALYVVVRDPETGVLVKLPGEVQADPQTGRLTTHFEELPPFPLGHVELSLRSGPRAPLVTPSDCGTYDITTTLTPSSGAAPLATSSSFTIDSGPGGGPCLAGAPGFSPGFQAGSLSNAAGRFSPFTMRVTRKDGEAELARLSAILPPGVLAKLAGVAKCPDGAIAQAQERSGREELGSPSCPPASRVGRLLAGAGAGDSLTYVPGSLYLAGPFGGDPLSVVAIVPAVTGPFDLGTVVTRVALTVNPITGVGEIDGSASEPIPHILEGIPLRLRDLRVYADRAEFTLNPTSCEPEATVAEIFGSPELVATPQARYQAADCTSLGFKPKLTLTLKGATKRRGHPALRSVLVPRVGDTNLVKAVVILPPSELIDNAHINNPCTRVQFDAEQCPATSVLGTARAYSPLLDEPLEGYVYFRSNGGERLLPDIVLDLRGLIRIIAVGEVTSRHARIRTTFRNIPDAPVSRLELNLYGAKRGLLQNNRDLCERKLTAGLVLTGHNGRVSTTQRRLGISCGARKPTQAR